MSGEQTLWEADGRRATRPLNAHYRESLHATYAGELTAGELTAWDGLTGNHPGLVGHDRERGFDLTMPAGQAVTGSYTSRDVASARHGDDYQSHFEQWERDRDAHPELLLPGRIARWSGVRFDLLRLGGALRGTGGCCVQDWVALDFETMREHGSSKAAWTFAAFTFLSPNSTLPTALSTGPPPAPPFDKPVDPSIAPIYLTFFRVGGHVTARKLFVDSSAPHDCAIAWLEDAQSLEFWFDEVLVGSYKNGEVVDIAGRASHPVRLPRSGLHIDIWHDNGHGGPSVKGVEGNPHDDQVFTVERFSIEAIQGAPATRTVALASSLSFSPRPRERGESSSGGGNV